MRERFFRHDVEDHERAIFQPREDLFATDRLAMSNRLSQFSFHDSFSTPIPQSEHAMCPFGFEWIQPCQP